jgi:antitoxin component of MazEF toxin-antitoxin module
MVRLGVPARSGTAAVSTVEEIMEHRIIFKKLGQSLGVVIPVAIVRTLELRRGMTAQLSVHDGEIRIRPIAPSRKTYSLAWLLRDYHQAGPQERHSPFGPACGRELL